MKTNTEHFDAIVIGTGISGGWAAKELCEQGLKTLVLERGKPVDHITDYPTVTMDTWDFKYREIAPLEKEKAQFKQARTGYATREKYSHWFVNDLKHPYAETKQFDWIRGYHVGGRSLSWGRQCLRLSDLDFKANKKEGIAVDWPIRYKDLAPWYDKVEEFIGVSGEKLGLEHLPDGPFLPAMELNIVEQDLKHALHRNFKGRHLTIGRFANLTDQKTRTGRYKCIQRNKCMRGCPLGAYFSSNSCTLPAAERTGNMTLKAHAIVSKIIYDDVSKKALGVAVIDANTHKKTMYKATVIFCCASTVASTAILLNSTSKRFPNGLGNDSGELGHNLMDHHYKVGATADVDGFENDLNDITRPASFHIPRFKNLHNGGDNTDYIRGYGFQGSASRKDWKSAIQEMTFGEDLKEQLDNPGSWKIGLNGFGETLPYHENRMFLDPKNKDEWGLPTVNFDCQFKENEDKMRKDMQQEAVNMLTTAGYKNVQGYDKHSTPGNAIHEMGTARMGHNPKTSVLNKFNQLHSVPNVYVTDGACMTSSAYQNPSLTYMALTARAVHHAVKTWKKEQHG